MLTPSPNRTAREEGRGGEGGGGGVARTLWRRAADTEWPQLRRCSNTLGAARAAKRASQRHTASGARRPTAQAPARARRAGRRAPSVLGRGLSRSTPLPPPLVVMAWGVLSHRGATTRGERAGSSGAAARPLHGRTTRGGLHRVLVLLLAATVVVVVMIVLRLVTGSADDVGTTNGSGVGGLMRWPRSSAAHRGDRASSLRVSVLVWPTSFSRLERHAERIEGIVETWASQEHWCGVTFRFRFAVGLEDEQASLKAAGHPSLESALGVNSRHRLVMSQSSKTPGANLLRAMRDALLVDKSDWIGASPVRAGAD